MTKIVCLSDTHTAHRQVEIPECDILIHAGDACGHGTQGEFSDFANWFNTLKQARYRIFVPGNHDFFCENEQSLAKAMIESTDGSIYLSDSGCQLEDKYIYGTPWTQRFHDWAFNADKEDHRGFARGPWLRDIYERIPSGTNILICHGPPARILDETPSGEEVGSWEMRGIISHLVDLELYVCGHIHHSRGQVNIGDVTFVNACIMDEAYNPVHKPIEVEL